MSCEKKVVIFIDGSNLYHIVRKMFPDKKQKNFDFERFVNEIIGDRKLIKVYYYNCPLDISHNFEAYTKQQRFFDKLNKISNFELILCRMQKIKIDGKVIYQVKEDDIHLAVDMVRLAYKNIYDTAILVSSDGDFVPAVLAVQETGKEVENIGFETKFSYHLKQKCDRFIKLKKDDVEVFFE